MNSSERMSRNKSNVNNNLAILKRLSGSGVTDNLIPSRVPRIINANYEVRYAWPEDCLLQCGRHGVVFVGSSILSDLIDTPGLSLATYAGMETAS
jgi:hypothetical protein